VFSRDVRDSISADDETMMADSGDDFIATVAVRPSEKPAICALQEHTGVPSGIIRDYDNSPLKKGYRLTRGL
jgi:hypothetical protein